MERAPGFRLSSVGRGFGDVGFYRLSRAGTKLRVWYISSLHETFRLYVDEDGLVRCEHDVRFLGSRVLTLHYRIAPAAPSLVARRAAEVRGRLVDAEGQ